MQSEPSFPPINRAPRIRTAPDVLILALPRIGLKIAIADVDEQGLSETAKEVGRIVGDANVISLATDVTKLDEVERLRDRVYEAWGEVS